MRTGFINILARKIIDAYFRCYTNIIFWMNHVKHGANCTVKGKIYIRNLGTIEIGDNLRANSGNRFNLIGGDTVLRLNADEDAIITIGNNVGFSNSTIYSTRAVIIEDDVLVGGSCKIYDSDFHSKDFAERRNSFFHGNEGTHIAALPVIIKKGVWIGSHCIVLKGITIGEHSIIGAGSVVTKSVPPNEIWAGNPIKYIGTVNKHTE
jgi:acetyltransferase-like isoleucine patch superfamily enzyme